MFGDISKAEKIHIACGYTDMRKSINGLAALVQQNFQLNSFQNRLFLFCGHRHDCLRALYWEGDGFVLLYKRLENGKFKWPKNAEAVRSVTVQEFRWLMEGLSIDQPRAVKKSIPSNVFPCKNSACNAENAHKYWIFQRFDLFSHAHQTTISFAFFNA